MILNTSDDVNGHIYIITNNSNNMSYIGQTVSHRKNKNKYRPFGYEGRFKDHISEAICNTKKKQCSYLNNAIRLYSKDAFTVSLLEECFKDQMDILEKEYIVKYNTLYPNGYNLTKGGKGEMFIRTSETVDKTTLLPSSKRGGCKERTTETRSKMSESLKETFGKQEVKEELMKRTQQQHLLQKINRFKGSCIDIDNLDQYLKERKFNGNKGILVKIGHLETNFVGKHETLEEIRSRAMDFLKAVIIAT